MAKNNLKVGHLIGKPWLACGKDELRADLEYVYFKDGHLYASDSHIIIRQNLKKFHGLDDDAIKNLDGKRIHYSICDMLSKTAKVIVFEKEHISFTANEQYKLSYSSPKVKDENFLMEWFERHEDKVNPANALEATLLSFNPNLLDILNKALSGTRLLLGRGYAHFILHNHGDGKPILVEDKSFPIEDCTMFLMPMIIN